MSNNNHNTQTTLFKTYEKPIGRSKLDADIIALHCKPDNHTITINMQLTAELRARELKLASLDVKGENCVIKFAKSEGSSNVCNMGKNTVINSKTMTENICKILGLEDGDYLIRVNRVYDDTELLAVALADVIRGAWFKLSPQTGTTQPATTIQQQLPWLSTFTDEQLYTELRRRGYEGTLQKTCTPQ